MLSFIRRIFRGQDDPPPVSSSIAGFLSPLGLSTDHPELYVKALTHGSYVKGHVESNERLEFIGDAVLGAAIADILYRRFPAKNEGRLSKMRSKLVSREALNELGTLIDIPVYLKHKIGKEEFSHTNNYIGNAFEALIGAIYLDKGYDTTYRFVEQRIITPFTDLDELDQEIRDFKSYVIIWAQKHKKEFYFRVDRTPGGSGDRRFVATLLIDREPVSEGYGRNKKTAQQLAAKAAVEQLDIAEE